MPRIILALALAGIIGCDNAEPVTQGPVAAPTIAGTPTAAGTPAAAPNQETVDNQTETIVIDVRSESEWNSGHVEQAVHIPHTEIAERIAGVTTDKNAKIVVYCEVGGRAGKAKQTLEDLGYTNVENAGGYDDVKNRF